MRVDIWCDGANSLKKGTIGMAAVVIYYSNIEDREDEVVDKTHWGWGANGIEHATNNLAELTAIKNSVSKVIVENPKDTELRIYTDSKWAICAINGEYKISHHVSLVEEIQSILSGFSTCRLIWVKGHAGSFYNEQCNMVAQKAAGTWRGK